MKFILLFLIPILGAMCAPQNSCKCVHRNITQEANVSWCNCRKTITPEPKMWSWLKPWKHQKCEHSKDIKHSETNNVDSPKPNVNHTPVQTHLTEEPIYKSLDGISEVHDNLLQQTIEKTTLKPQEEAAIEKSAPKQENNDIDKKINGIAKNNYNEDGEFDVKELPNTLRILKYLSSNDATKRQLAKDPEFENVSKWAENDQTAYAERKEDDLKSKNLLQNGYQSDPESIITSGASISLPEFDKEQDGHYRTGFYFLDHLFCNNGQSYTPNSLIGTKRLKRQVSDKNLNFEDDVHCLEQIGKIIQDFIQTLLGYICPNSPTGKSIPGNIIDDNGVSGKPPLPK